MTNDDNAQPPRYLTFAQYAKARGVTHQNISALIKLGSLTRLVLDGQELDYIDTQQWPITPKRGKGPKKEKPKPEPKPAKLPVAGKGYDKLRIEKPGKAAR